MDKGQNCPRCKSRVNTQDKVTYCSNNTCMYVNLNPITYENQIFQNQEEKLYARFTHAMPLGVDALESQKRQFSYKARVSKGKNFIQKCCLFLKIGNGIKYLAIDKLSQIIYLQYHKKVDQQTSLKKSKKESKNLINCCLYCLQYACFKHQIYFHEINLIRYFKVTYQTWKKTLYDLNIKMKQSMMESIIVKPEYILKRVCWKRQINKEEQNAMIELCENIGKEINKELRDNTLAAISFILICQESMKYQNVFNVFDLCRNHDNLMQNGTKSSQILACFDVSAYTIKGILHTIFNNKIIQKLLPEWTSRRKRPLHQND